MRQAKLAWSALMAWKITALKLEKLRR